MADKFQPLAFAAGECVDRLTELQVAEADFLQQFQAFDRAPGWFGIGEGREKFNRLVHRGVEHVGDAPILLRSSRRKEALTDCRLPIADCRFFNQSLLTSAATNLYFQNMRAIPAAIAVRAADEHVAEKLHFNFLKARAATTLALTLRRIKTEGTGVQAALLRHLGLCKDFADVFKRADVNRRIGARGFAQRRLIHQHDAADVFVTGHASF